MCCAIIECVVRSAIKMNDLVITPTPVIGLTGSFLLFQFRPTRQLISSDVFAFAEDVLQTEVNDIMIVKNSRLQPTGYVYVHVAITVSSEHVRNIRKYKFHNYPVEVKLFRSVEEFKKSVESIAKTKNKELELAQRSDESIVFAKSKGDNEDVYDDMVKMFRELGDVLKIEKIKENIMLIRYPHSDMAFRASRIVQRLFKNVDVGVVVVKDSRHTLMFHNIKTPELILPKIEKYGKVEKYKYADDKTLYVRFQDLLDSQIVNAFMSKELIPCNFSSFTDF